MKVTYEKWLKSPFGTHGLPPENPRTRHIYIYIYIFIVELLPIIYLVT